MSSNNNDFQSTIDEQLDKFDAAWHTAVTPDIHDHLPMPSSMPDAPRKRLLLELIKIDLEHRWKKYSEDPATIVSQEDLNVDDTANEKSECWTLEDYVRRFSELGSPQTLPAEVIAEEYRVRCRWGDCPSIDDYRSRFPLQQSQWWPLLDQITTELKNHEQRASRAVHPVDARELPEMIGRYRVLGRIDAGGQAQVFRAVHPTLQNEVIIKLGHRSLSLGSAERDRLVAEGRLLVELNHPNLARLYDLDFHGDRPFLVMDYIRGRNLRQYAAATRLPAKESARIIDAIAHALHDVHQRGIVHQDIKPANILISADGTPHLIDFGLARVSDAWKGETDKSTGISGTLQYMAPEQARSEGTAISERTDVFALGAVLYFLLTGKPPYNAETIHETHELAKHCRFDKDALHDASIPVGLRQICLTAMQERPEDRFANVGELSNALRPFMMRAKTRRRWLELAISAMMLALMAYTLWLVRNRERKEPGPEPVPVTQHRDGTPLARQFRLTLLEPAGVASKGPGQVYQFTDGHMLSLQVDVGQNCYLGIWLVGPDGKEQLLFPEPGKHHDHYFEPGRHDLPTLELSPSEGPEDILVCATTNYWAEQAGVDHGHRVVFLDPQELAKYGTLSRGAKLATSAAAETRLPFFVNERKP